MRPWQCFHMWSTVAIVVLGCVVHFRTSMFNLHIQAWYELNQGNQNTWNDLSVVNVEIWDLKQYNQSQLCLRNSTSEVFLNQMQHFDVYKRAREYIWTRGWFTERKKRLIFTPSGGAAELRKKGKPKRPSIKTLFGEYFVWHIITERERERLLWRLVPVEWRFRERMQDTLGGSNSKCWFHDWQTQQTDLMATCKGASCVICPHPWRCQKVQNLHLLAAFRHLFTWVTIKNNLHMLTRVMLDRHYLCPALTFINRYCKNPGLSCSLCELCELFAFCVCVPKKCTAEMMRRLIEELWRIVCTECKLISLQVVSYL